MIESIHMKPVRTRIAPSPTGENLHIGNAYSALINYVFAKKHEGQFIIRIEDTDRTRLVEGSEVRIIESLNWLKIPHDEGPDIGGPYSPYRQSDRLDIYKKYALELVGNGHAYYCFCTKDRLDQMRQKQESEHKPPMYDGLCKSLTKTQITENLNQGLPYVIRLNVPDDGQTKFNDLIRGEVIFDNKLIDDQILLKSDGFPTYHLAVVIDDHIMGISHIIRGEEWLSSTPKHILLYNFFGWDIPQIAHFSVLRNPDRSKLSKRKNPVWVSWFKDQGFLPEAICNYLALMAWAHPEGKEIFTVSEMMKVFDIGQIQTSAPIFDMTKLRWMNGEYLRKSQISNLKSQIFKFYKEKYALEIIEKILPLVIERMKTLKEFESLAGFFFERPVQFEREVNKDYIKLLKAILENIKNWNHDRMEEAIRQKSDEMDIKARDLFMELRLKITGKTVGPPLLESLEILGKEETLFRLK